MEITKEIAEKVLAVVDAGLVDGVGVPEPGKMCVEAAVCYAMGLPHGDEPTCVAPALRALKIALNDAAWSSPRARAKGMRRLAVIQLGSRNALDEVEFAKRVAALALRTSVPRALRAAAALFKPQSEYKQKLLDSADLCERDGTESAAESAARSAARSARSAAESAAWSARSAAESAAESADKELARFAEDVVQILVDMKVPGAKWLALTEIAS